MNRRHFGKRGHVPTRLGGSLMQSHKESNVAGRDIEMVHSNVVKPMRTCGFGGIASQCAKKHVIGMGSILDAVKLPNVGKKAKTLRPNIKFSI